MTIEALPDALPSSDSGTSSEVLFLSPSVEAERVRMAEALRKCGQCLLTRLERTEQGIAPDGRLCVGMVGAKVALDPASTPAVIRGFTAAVTECDWQPGTLQQPPTAHITNDPARLQIYARATRQLLPPSRDQ